MKTKSFKKNMLVSLLTMILLASIVVGGTYAYFTDSVSITGNTITAGDISIEAQLYKGSVSEDDTNKVSEIVIENFAPGDTATYVLQIANMGSLDAEYMVLLSATDDSLLDALTITYGDDEDNEMKFKDGVFQTGWTEIEADSDATQVNIVITFDALVGNEFAGESFNFNLTILATQDLADDSTAATAMYVFADSAGDFAAVKSAGYTVVLTNDIEDDVTLIYGVDIIFNGYTLTGDLTITDNAATYFTIGSYVGDGTIIGDVTITANNATVIFNTDVDGTKSITAATGSNSFHFNGSFVGDEGTGTINIAGGKAVISTNVGTVNAVADTSNEDAKEIQIVIEETATVSNLTVDSSVTESVSLDNSGTITELKNDSSSASILVDGSPYEDGTEAFPYLIDTYEKLAAIRDDINSGVASLSSVLCITADIEIPEGVVWEPIGSNKTSTSATMLSPFTGKIYGENIGTSEDEEYPTISGINSEVVTVTYKYNTYNSTTHQISGFIGYAGDGMCVENLNFELDIDIETEITKALYLGGVVAYVYSGAEVLLNNISVGGDINVEVSGNDVHAGGIIGYDYGKSTISNSEIKLGDMSITSTTAATVGSMIGRKLSYETVLTNNSISFDSIVVNSGTSYAYVGGLIGHSNTTVTINGDLEIAGSISGESETNYVYIGGLLGYNSTTTITGDVEVSGNMSAESSSTSYVGGLFGYNTTTTITGDVEVSGNISAENSSYAYVGGLIGSNKSSSTTTIIGDVKISSKISVESSSSGYAGGLIASNSSTTTITGDVEVSGDISAENSSSNIYAGGLIAHNSAATTINGNIKISSNISVATSGSTPYVGGIAGHTSSGTITINGDCVLDCVISATKNSSNYGNYAGIVAGYAGTDKISISESGSITISADTKVNDTAASTNLVCGYGSISDTITIETQDS